jgi:hypothetical protein
MTASRRRSSATRRRLPALGIAGLLALLGCREDVSSPNPPETAVAEVAQAPNSWITRAPLPIQALSGFSVGAAANSAGQWFAYTFGGDDGVSSQAIVERYNVQTNTWGAGSGASPNATAMNGIGKIGNRLYMTGGGRCCRGSEPIYNTTSAYDLSTGQLFQKADLPRATTDGVTGVINGKLYVLAGFCSGEPTDPGHCIVEGTVRQFYRYDPATNTWIFRHQPPHFHRNGGGAVIDGKFYVVGGGSSQSNQLDVYDPVTNTWTSRAPIPSGGAQMSAAVIQNKMFVVLLTNSSGTGVIKAYLYDPASNTWKSRAAPRVFGQLVRVQLNGQARLFLPGSSSSYMYAP